MPLHLDSIIKSDTTEIFSWILQHELNKCEDACASDNKYYIHTSKLIYDKKTGKPFGKFVFTLKNNEEQKALEVLDADIVLDNDECVELKFYEKLKQSSDANEYYNVETVEENHHFQIETVNRYFVNSDIVNQTYKVSLSAFPFELTIYDSIDSFNNKMGFSSDINVANTGMRVSGFSETFTAPSDLFKTNTNSDETFSFIIGKVKSFKDVSIQLNNETINFVITFIETGAGNMPVAMSRDVFDLSNLNVGRIVAMRADVKADFKTYQSMNMDYEEVEDIFETDQENEFDNVRYELDFIFIPKIFYRDKVNFIKSLLNKKGIMFYEFFTRYYNMMNPVLYKGCPKTFRKDEFSVIEFAVSNSKHVLYVTLPNEHRGSRAYCTAYAYTFEKTLFGFKNIQFFTVEQSIYNTNCIGTMTEDKSHLNFDGASNDVRENINRIAKIAF